MQGELAEMIPAPQAGTDGAVQLGQRTPEGDQRGGQREPRVAGCMALSQASRQGPPNAAM